MPSGKGTYRKPGRPSKKRKKQSKKKQSYKKTIY